MQYSFTNESGLVKGFSYLDRDNNKFLKQELDVDVIVQSKPQECTCNEVLC